MYGRRTLVLATATLVSTTMACKLVKEAFSDAPASTAPAAVPVSPPPSAVASVIAPPTASAEPLKPVGLFADKLPAGLVPVDRAPVPVEAMKTAAKVEGDASDARKAKDFEKAIGLYLSALKTDPGFPEARYNLARTLILDDQIDAGLAVLDQLYRIEDCARCEGLLLRAAQEKDFQKAYERPEFKERTDRNQGVGKRLPTVPHAAKQVIAWLDAPTLSNLPSVVDTRTHIVLQTPKGYTQLKGAKAFIEFVLDKENFPKGRKWGATVGPPVGMTLECKGTCCDVDTYDPPRGRSVLRQLCFKHQGNAAVALFKVKVD